MLKKNIAIIMCAAILGQYVYPAISVFAEETDQVTVESGGEIESGQELSQEIFPEVYTTNEDVVASQDVSLKEVHWELVEEGPILVGQAFTVRVMGNLPSTKFILPEGIIYNEDVSGEDQGVILFNEELKELTLTKLDELEVSLTAERSGNYKLELLGEEGSSLSELVIEVNGTSEDLESDDSLEEENLQDEKNLFSEDEKDFNQFDIKISTSKNAVENNGRYDIKSNAAPVSYIVTLRHSNAKDSLTGGKMTLEITGGVFEFAPSTIAFTQLNSSALNFKRNKLTLKYNELKSGIDLATTIVINPSPSLDATNELKVTAKFEGKIGTTSIVQDKTTVFYNTGEEEGYSVVKKGDSLDWGLRTSTEVNGEVMVGGTAIFADGLAPNTTPPSKTGFENLKLKMTVNGEDKWGNWFNKDRFESALVKTTSGSDSSRAMEFKEGTTKSTRIFEVGMLVPYNLKDIRFLMNFIDLTENVNVGDILEVDLVYLNNDEEIFSQKFKIEAIAESLKLNLDAYSGASSMEGGGTDRNNGQLALGQEIMTAVKFDGYTGYSSKGSEALKNLTIEVDVPDKLIPMNLRMGFVNDGSGKPNVKRVEYMIGDQWHEADKIANEELFSFPTNKGDIEKIRIVYRDFKGEIIFKQPERITYKVKDDPKLIDNTISFIYNLSVEAPKDTPKEDLDSKGYYNKNSNTLTYIIREKLPESIPSEIAIGEYISEVPASGFEGEVPLPVGTKYTKNYRLAATNGQIEDPYIFVKIPKGMILTLNDYTSTENVNKNQTLYGDSPSFNYQYATEYGTKLKKPAIETGEEIGPESIIQVEKREVNGELVDVEVEYDLYIYPMLGYNMRNADRYEMFILGHTYEIQNMTYGYHEMEIGMGSLSSKIEKRYIHEKESYNARDFNEKRLSTSVLDKFSEKFDEKLKVNGKTLNEQYFSKTIKLNVEKSHGFIPVLTAELEGTDGIKDPISTPAEDTPIEAAPGQNIIYKIDAKNTRSETLKNVELINILPYEKDQSTGNPDQYRESDFLINMTSKAPKIVTSNNEEIDFSFFYSTSNDPPRFYSSTGQPIDSKEDAKWIEVDNLEAWNKVDWTKVRSFRLIIDSDIKPGDSFQMTYTAQVDPNAKRPESGGIKPTALNNLAYRADTNTGEYQGGEVSGTKVAIKAAAYKGQISGRVFNDVYENGEYNNPPDSFVSAVALELFKFEPTEGKFVTTNKIVQTDFEGKFVFNGINGDGLIDGTYKIQLHLPENARIVSEGKNGIIGVENSYWVRNGEDDKLGEFEILEQKMTDLEIPIFRYTPLSGKIDFKDGTSGISLEGFNVRVLDSMGKVVESEKVTSDAEGWYEFKQLEIKAEETYTIEATSPRPEINLEGSKLKFDELENPEGKRKVTITAISGVEKEVDTNIYVVSPDTSPDLDPIPGKYRLTFKDSINDINSPLVLAGLKEGEKIDFGSVEGLKTFTRKGYKLKGWKWLKSNGTEVVYAKDKSFTMPEEDVTLWAIWEKDDGNNIPGDSSTSNSSDTSGDSSTDDSGDTSDDSSTDDSGDTSDDSSINDSSDAPSDSSTESGDSETSDSSGDTTISGTNDSSDTNTSEDHNSGSNVNPNKQPDRDGGLPQTGGNTSNKGNQSSKKEKCLPQTGEVSSTPLVIFGLFIVVGVCLGFVKKNRRKKLNS